MVRGKSNFQTKTALFRLLIRHVEAADCYSGKMVEASKYGKNGDNRGNRNFSSKLRCYNCRGNHRAKDCKSSGRTSRYSGYVSPLAARPSGKNQGTSTQLQGVQGRDMDYKKIQGRQHGSMN